MAKLTSKQRKNLSGGEFAIPEKKAYPINDPAHARNALARVSQFGTPAEKSQVQAAVHRHFPDIGQDNKDKKPVPKKG